MWGWERNVGGDTEEFIGEEVNIFDGFYIPWSRRRGHKLKKRSVDVVKEAGENAVVSCSSHSGNVFFGLCTPACLFLLEGLQNGAVVGGGVRELCNFVSSVARQERRWKAVGLGAIWKKGRDQMAVITSRSRHMSDHMEKLLSKNR